MEPAFLYQNQGRDRQKDLLSAWYDGLSRAGEEGRKVAYLFIPGNIGELLRVFDFELVYPEINALQAGIKKVSGSFVLKAEDMGLSSDVCSYVKSDVGMALSGNTLPVGTIPKPDLLLCTYVGCATFIHWFEILSRMYNVPVVMLDVPYLRENTWTAADLEYVVAQLKELIGTCERITGKRYDEDKLKAILGKSVEAEDLWVKILQAGKHVPSPFDAYFEGVFFMAPIYILRGTQECVDYYEIVWKEIEERLQHHLGPLPEERFRVVFEGTQCWTHFRAFWELFKKWGVVSVASAYTKVGGLYDFGFRHDPTRPLESLAEYCFLCYTNHSWQNRTRLLETYVREYQADALVINAVKSCRSFGAGLGDLREEFIHDKGIPTLMIETDLVDPRYFQQAQLRNRIDAFFEALEHRRLTGHAAAPRAAASQA